ncbi:hypothetical protein XENTR_v10003175 [Xenopus tropicalis]|nr:hypothetical protein XENTR_v10003175 [Xenopus tropicalis]
MEPMHGTIEHLRGRDERYPAAHRAVQWAEFGRESAAPPGVCDSSLHTGLHLHHFCPTLRLCAKQPHISTSAQYPHSIDFSINCKSPPSYTLGRRWIRVPRGQLDGFIANRSISPNAATGESEWKVLGRSYITPVPQSPIAPTAVMLGQRVTLPREPGCLTLRP